MRKRHFLFLVGLSVCSWGVFTYFLFLQNPSGFKSENKALSLFNHLNKLEQDLKNQKDMNKVLLSSLQQWKSKTLTKNMYQQLLDSVNWPDSGSKREMKDAQPLQQGVSEVSEGEGTVPPSEPVIAVLMLACNRVTVKRALDRLLQFRPSAAQFPIVVSQDCGHASTAQVIRSYGDQLVHIQQPDLSDITVPPKEKKFKGYFKISRHYAWALNQTFHEFNYETVIIVEDDLDVATDFFDYFLGAYPILKGDPTLWCVSAWNDNGKASLIDEDQPELLYRTDFFPGLGWMMTRNLWLELQTKWPKAYWDDWMRQPEQRRERACIRPEVSRTKTFGKIGVSNGLFYDKHLKYIKLNEKHVPFAKKNLTYLLKDNYDVQFVKQVYDSPVVTLAELKSNTVKYEGPVRITYHTKDAYKRTAKMLGLMDDFRSGVPRSGYRGVVSFIHNKRRVYLAPSANWHGYDPSWS